LLIKYNFFEIIATIFYMDIKEAASAYSNIANIGGGLNNIASANDKSSVVNDASFSSLITKSLGSALEAGKKAEEVSTLAVMGKADIAELAFSVGKAERVLQEVVAVRDKVISAYQQIMQMPI
jgi:flagellar hook-basal body complex protein FliE